jgi:RNA polymerase sigma factor (sigma-70 family)
MSEAQIAEVMLPEVRYIIKWLRARKRLLGSENLDEQMESEGMLALLRAIRHFDPNAGTKFSTYLVTAVTRQCQQYLTKHAVTPGCVHEKRRATQVSLSAPCRRRNRETLLHSIARTRIAPTPSLSLSQRSVDDFWQEATKVLPARHREIFLARFRDELTLEEVGPKFGVTRERIRQITVKCLERLKNDETLRVRLDAATAGQISA